MSTADDELADALSDNFHFTECFERLRLTVINILNFTTAECYFCKRFFNKRSLGKVGCLPACQECYDIFGPVPVLLYIGAGSPWELSEPCDRGLMPAVLYKYDHPELFDTIGYSGDCGNCGSLS